MEECITSLKQKLKFFYKTEYKERFYLPKSIYSTKNSLIWCEIQKIQKHFIDKITKKRVLDEEPVINVNSSKEITLISAK